MACSFRAQADPLLTRRGVIALALNVVCAGTAALVQNRSVQQMVAFHALAGMLGGAENPG
jgi:hypothetical protein